MLFSDSSENRAGGEILTFYKISQRDSELERLRKTAKTAEEFLLIPSKRIGNRWKRLPSQSKLGKYFDRQGKPIDPKKYYSSEDFKNMADRPKPGKCEACGNRCRSYSSLCFDHCHETLKFRGWLCNGCNSALGFMLNDPVAIRKLADYQEKFLKKLNPIEKESKEFETYPYLLA